ncbi:MULTISPECIES: hypothetical protein [unclassified Micromonospora]|uniref:hypothetical protein n=1 Tax=unclassified Micromonospora TaxID=2617518 RepID=UPI0015901100|nr:hypothetical protein [Verrucosispora sp. NA02020]QKW15094.1 hypothetical protein HUT12_21545 [Verrucosispora sp. NA02020]
MDDRIEAAPPEIVEAMVWFEERYGGLWYPLLGSNGMEHGLGGVPLAHRGPLGLAFEGIVDGDWTWPVDVLVDGRTAMGPGQWSYRVIDRSVDQRLESHALLLSVRGWCHRTFTCYTPRDVVPGTDERHLPPPVPEASGPAECWWLDDDAGVAVQATLAGWPPERDEWTLRYFTRTPAQTADASPTVFRATAQETVPALWCTLCSQPIIPGLTCPRARPSE